MNIKTTYINKVILYVEANGKLDIYNAQDYLDEVKDHLKLFIKELVLEFSKINYVSSIGLRVILELHKIMQERNCKLKLKNVNEDILNTFKMTGFDKFLIVENDSENA